eukprot:gene31207-40570_t
MTSSVIVLNATNNVLLDSDSPTSLIDNGVVDDEHVSQVNNNLPHYPQFNNLKKFIDTNRQRSKKFGIRTIHNIELPVLQPQTVSTWKTEICRFFPQYIDPSCLMLIRDGKSLLDTEMIGDNNSVMKSTHVLFKTTSKSPVTIIIRNSEGVENKLEVPISIKVSTLKKELYSKKLISLRPQFQRLIYEGKILKDFSILGDYLLAAVKSGRSIHPKFVVHVCKTIDLGHEVDITVRLNEKHSLKLSFEVSKPIGLIVDILHKQYMFPYPKADMRYAFFLPTATTDSRSSLSSLGRELDNSKCLLDYGFTNSTKSISLELARCPTPPQQPNPLMIQVPSPSSGLLLMPTAVSPAALYNLMSLYMTVARDVVENGKDTMQALKEATVDTPLEGSSTSSSSRHGQIAQSSIFGKRTHENRKDSDKRTKAAAEPTDAPAKIQKLPSAATSSASPMFKGLRKGFLSSSGASDGSSAAESKKSDGLFSGMKKGFLSSGSSKASQKHKKSAP